MHNDFQRVIWSGPMVPLNFFIDGLSDFPQGRIRRRKFLPFLQSI
jgi:hypothetical protein